MNNVQISNVDRLQITVDGVAWLPWREVPTVPSTFRLTTEHIAAAKELVGGWDTLQWALETESSVLEMQTWNRSKHAEKVADAKEPKAVPVKKAKGLFDN